VLFRSGCGTTAGALGFGGYTSAITANMTEKWSGTTWATTSLLNTRRLNLGGCGSTAAALAFGGDTNNSPNPTPITEIWEQFRQYGFGVKIN
jgi:hypothetical protein